MSLSKIILTTPEGKIAIVKERITAVIQVELHGHGDTLVRSRVYIIGDNDPFNILEDFDDVCGKI